MLQWVFTAFAIGLALGYLFSSKFCKVTIRGRVEKEIALNQALRGLFAKNIFLITSTINAVYFNTPIHKTLIEALIGNQNEIIKVLRAYYGDRQTTKINKLLHENALLIPDLVNAKDLEKVQEPQSKWEKNIQEIAKLFVQLNSNVDALNSSNLQKQISLLRQTIEALQAHNWDEAMVIFEALFDQAMQFANELDKSITEQFPQKF